MKTEVVLHVAVAISGIVGFVAFEFTEDGLVGFTENIGQNIQAAAVSHADDNFFCSFIRRRIDHGFDGGNGRFPAFQRESLFTDVLRAEEFLENNGAVEASENAFAFFRGIIDEMRVLLDAFAEPFYFFRIADIVVLESERFAVSLVQVVDNVSERGLAQANFLPYVKSLVEIGFFQAEFFDTEMSFAVFPLADRVGVGNEVSLVAVGFYEIEYFEFIQRNARAASVLRIAGEGKIESFEEFSELRVDRTDVVFIVIVQRFDISRFGITYVGENVHQVVYLNVKRKYRSFFT